MFDHILQNMMIIGILFLGCGDSMNKPKEEIDDENFEARLDLFLGFVFLYF